MCNLYSITRNAEAIADLFRVSHNRSQVFDPMPAVFPGWNAPVVRRAEDGERELLPMSWGFVLPQPGRAARRVTNTRDDKMLTRFWKDAVTRRRCLVPATAFCEPNDGRRPGEKATWHWFALRGTEPRPPFSFAGIWQAWKGPLKKDGPPVVLNTYSILTTTPSSATSSINHERSPVLLTSDEDRDLWLDGTADDALALVKPIDGNRLAIVQAGLEKEDLLA
ncbi:MAG: SOS response-associated peptidase [Hyphomicrobiaceae bacterium]